MAAYICYKPSGSCQKCEHYRWDDERMDYACFVQFDEKKKLDDERSSKK